MENNREKKLDDEKLEETSGGQETINSWVYEPKKKQEEVFKAIEELINCFKPHH